MEGLDGDFVFNVGMNIDLYVRGNEMPIIFLIHDKDVTALWEGLLG